LRFDKPIFIQNITRGEYDAVTGNYGADTIEEVQRFASVTHSGTDTLNLVYGEIRQGSLTIRLQNHYDGPVERVRVGDRIYRVDFRRQLRTKETLVVSEVQ